MLLYGFGKKIFFQQTKTYYAYNIKHCKNIYKNIEHIIILSILIT